MRYLQPSRPPNPTAARTPIPTSVLLTALLATATWQGRTGAAIYGGSWLLAGAVLHPLTLLFALSGTLMVSKTLRIPKL